MSRSRLIALGLAQPKKRHGQTSQGITLTEWLAAHPAAKSHDPGVVSDWKKKWREANREHLRAYQKRWRANKKRKATWALKNASASDDALRG